jgi:hypothetical protein
MDPERIRCTDVLTDKTQYVAAVFVCKALADAARVSHIGDHIEVKKILVDYEVTVQAWQDAIDQPHMMFAGQKRKKTDDQTGGKKSKQERLDAQVKDIEDIKLHMQAANANPMVVGVMQQVDLLNQRMDTNLARALLNGLSGYLKAIWSEI